MVGEVKSQSRQFGNMEVETREVENGTEIQVRSDTDVAIVVEGENERIYLPDAGSSDSTYYMEDPGALQREEEKYSVVHSGAIDEIKVFSS